MKYLFYKFNGDIYWIDAKIIEELKIYRASKENDNTTNH